MTLKKSLDKIQKPGKAVQVMKIRVFCKVLFVCLYLSLSFTTLTYAETFGREIGTLGEISIRGRVVEINKDYRFIVINVGRADGVKDGMIFNIFQRDEEVAKVKVTKVRRYVSGCDIQLVYAGRGMGVGDLVIYKEPAPVAKLLKPLEPTRMIEVEPIVVDIDAPKQAILRNTLKVFGEFGVVITHSDPKEHTMRAEKYITMPLVIDAMTDWGPYTRDKVLYTAEVTTTPRYNRLTIRLRGVYDKEGQLYNHEIKKTSPTYKEVQEIAFTIKDISEKL